MEWKRLILPLLMCICLVFGVALLPKDSIPNTLDMILEKEALQTENTELKDVLNSANQENFELKSELASLKFELAFPNGIVGENNIIELNFVSREVVEEGDALTVIDNAQVTINDGYYNGGQTPFGGVGNTAIWCNGENAKVTINDGYFYINGLTTDENGIKDTGHIDLIYCSKGTIEINGGLFEGANEDVWLLNCKDTSYSEGTASIVVKGGTFINWNPADCVSEGEHTSFVAEGYTVIVEEIEGVNYYTVVADFTVEESEENVTP